MMPYQFQPTLAIKSLDVDTASRTVHMEAQPDGFFASIARLFGLGGKSKMEMNENGFWLHAQSFSGKTRTFCPLANVASCVLSEVKPIEFLMAGIVLIPTGLGMAFAADATQMIGLGLLVLAIGGIVAFFIANQRMTLGVVTNGGTASTLKVKAKGQRLKDLQAAFQLMEQLVDIRSGGGNVADPLASGSMMLNAPAPAAPGGESKIGIECPHCGVKLKVKASKRGQDVTCPGCQEVFVA